jgi:ribonuclease BN (tRNA processing enzyme)
MLKVEVIGVGDAFSEKYNSSSIVIESGDFRLMIDCCERIRKTLREAREKSGSGLNLGQIDHVMLTHLHGDHVGGLEAYAFYKLFVDRRKPHLYAGAPVLDELWDGRLKAPMHQLYSPDFSQVRHLTLPDYFELHPLEPGQPFEIGPLQVEIFPTRHHIPTFAARFSDGTRTLGYSADTTFDPTLLNFLAPADLIVHETGLGVHTPYEKLAALPAPLLQKMRLIHYGDDFDKAASVIQPLEEGQIFEV